MSNMKIEQLHYFREAAKWQSLSVAAEKNYVSQPAFSAAISKLEKELNVTLLQRNRRGVTPTSVGILILEKINDIFNSIQDIENIARDSNSESHLVLASTSTVCDVLIPMLLKEMRSKALSYALSLIAVESHEVYQQVSTGVANLGVTTFDERLITNSLTFTPLFEDEYLLYVGPRSSLWDKKSITREELMKQNYVAYGNEFLDSRADIWGRELFKEGNPKISLRSNNLNSIKNIILNDDYVAFFPKFGIEHDIYITQGLLRTVSIADEPLLVQYGYLESSHYKLSVRDKAFIAVLEECVEKFFARQYQASLSTMNFK